MARYNLTKEQAQRRAAARRENALAKADPSESAARVAPDGPMSFPIKAKDPDVERMIREFERTKIKRGRGG